jgi:hypothetical protein
MTICYIFFGRLYFGWRLNILSYLLAQKLTAAAGAARFWIHFVYSVDEKTIGPEGNNALYTTAPVLLWTCFVFHAATYNVKTVQPSPKNELYSVYIEAYIYQHEIRNIQHIHTVSSHLFDFLFCFCFDVSVYSHSTNEAEEMKCVWHANSFGLVVLLLVVHSGDSSVSCSSSYLLDVYNRNEDDDDARKRVSSYSASRLQK